jgi:ABC-type amino acid transport substrate-binding protein
MRVKGKPYKPPHILFWNLRSTSGFPALSSQQNASMMSGFSPAMLNLFCEQGIDSLQACSPWSLFLKGLENERYSIMEIKAREFFL